MKSITRFISSMLLIVITQGASLFAVTHATLVANNRDDILDSELENLINTNIRSKGYESIILAFTQCYGEDCFDDFAGYGNTALLSGSQICHTSQYGGYHRGLAQNLVAGTTTDTAHAAASLAALPGDSPRKGGTNQNVGGTGSTHILVWAGKPNSLDQDDINDVHNHFAGRPNTTVDVLSGNGYGQHVDGAANRGNLEVALHNIGTQMGSNEQFILFVTDHGDKDDVNTNVSCPATITLAVPAYTAMLNDPCNQPVLSLFSSSTIGTTCFTNVTVNGHNLSLPPEIFQIDYDSNGTPEEYKYMMDVAESWLQPTGNQVVIEIDEPTCGSILLNRVSLGSGAISRTNLTPSEDVPTVSEWGLIIMAGALLSAGMIVIVRRTRLAV